MAGDMVSQSEIGATGGLEPRSKAGRLSGIGQERTGPFGQFGPMERGQGSGGGEKQMIVGGESGVVVDGLISNLVTVGRGGAALYSMHMEELVARALEQRGVQVKPHDVTVGIGEGTMAMGVRYGEAPKGEALKPEVLAVNMADRPGEGLRVEGEPRVSVLGQEPEIEGALRQVGEDPLNAVSEFLREQMAARGFKFDGKFDWGVRDGWMEVMVAREDKSPALAEPAKPENVTVVVPNPIAEKAVAPEINVPDEQPVRPELARQPEPIREPIAQVAAPQEVPVIAEQPVQVARGGGSGNEPPEAPPPTALLPSEEPEDPRKANAKKAFEGAARAVRGIMHEPGKNDPEMVEQAIRNRAGREENPDVQRIMVTIADRLESQDEGGKKGMLDDLNAAARRIEQEEGAAEMAKRAGIEKTHRPDTGGARLVGQKPIGEQGEEPAGKAREAESLNGDEKGGINWQATLLKAFVVLETTEEVREFLNKHKAPANVMREALRLIKGEPRVDEPSGETQALKEAAAALQAAAEAMRWREERRETTRPTKVEARPEPERPRQEAGLRNFAEAYGILRKYYNMAGHLTPQEQMEFNAALAMKQRAVQWAKDSHPFEAQKGEVDAFMQKLIEDEDYWRQVQAGSGRPGENTMTKVVNKLDDLMRREETEPEWAKGVTDAWHKGIAINWRLAYYRAKQNNHVGDYVAIIRDLEEQQKYLGWGYVEDPVRQTRMDQLALTALGWEEKYGMAVRKIRETPVSAGDASYFKARRIPPEKRTDAAIDEDFLRTFGLPETVYGHAELGENGYEALGHDVAGLLSDYFVTGVVPSELNIENMKREIRRLANGGRGVAEKLSALTNTVAELQGAIFPLIEFGFKFKDGKFQSLGGNGKDALGLLHEKSELKLNVPYMCEVWGKDDLAKRSLGMWLAMDDRVAWGDGRFRADQRKGEGDRTYRKVEVVADKDTVFREWDHEKKDFDLHRVKKGERVVLSVAVGEIADKDALFALKFAGEMKRLLYTSPKSENDLQAETRDQLKLVAEEMATHLSGNNDRSVRCGTARTNMMLRFATILGFRPMFGEYRKFYTETGPYETLVSADPDDVVLKPLLYKIKLGNQAVSFGFVEKQLATGVGAMLGAVGKLGNPYDLQKYYGGLAAVMDTMKKSKLIEEGEDQYPDTGTRYKERDTLYQSLTTMEIPQISRLTLEKLKKRKVYGGKGKAREAGVGFVERERRGIQRAWDALIDKSDSIQ